MPRYTVDISYRCETTYNGTVEVEAANEEAAETKALEQAKKEGVAGWDVNEDGGDFEVENIEEMD